MVVVVVVAVAVTVKIVVAITKLTIENTPLLCLHIRQYHCCHCYHHTWHDIRFPYRWLFSLTPSLRLATLLPSNENFVYCFPFHVAFQGTLTFASLLHSVASPFSYPTLVLLLLLCSSYSPALLQTLPQGSFTISSASLLFLNQLSNPSRSSHHLPTFSYGTFPETFRRCFKSSFTLRKADIEPPHCQ